MAMSERRRFAPDRAILDRLDPARLVASYDRASDTLMIHFFGRGRPAVSVPSPKPLARDFVFLRFDPVTGELVGIQIEDFLRLYLRDHPEAAVLLDGADLAGISQDEVDAAVEGLPRDGAGAVSREAVIEALVMRHG